MICAYCHAAIQPGHAQCASCHAPTSRTPDDSIAARKATLATAAECGLMDMADARTLAGLPDSIEYRGDVVAIRVGGSVTLACPNPRAGVPLRLDPDVMFDQTLMVSSQRTIALRRMVRMNPADYMAMERTSLNRSYESVCGVAAMYLPDHDAFCFADPALAQGEPAFSEDPL